MADVKMVNLKIDGMDVSVPAGTTVLNAAASIGIKIPTLCYLKEINEIGACRVCVVEVKGARSLVASCVYPVAEGMEVFTNTPKVRQSRKTTIELLLSNHRKDCLSCSRNTNCELQRLSYEYGCDMHAFEGEVSASQVDVNNYLVRDNSKCVLCRRCVAACKNTQGIGVIGATKRGFKTEILSAFEMPLASTSCVACGQCINVCPTGALHEREEIDVVMAAIHDPEKIVVAGPAPSVRAGLGEEFGYEMGTNVEGKMVSALRLLGFDKVFDVNFAADMTIMEESHELIERIKNGGALPMFTSCSPGWINYVEHYYPELIPNLSSCKSPQQMFGALVKTYYAQKLGVEPQKLFVVSIMPCTAKKGEKLRPNQAACGEADIDAVLTTRELAKMIKQNGIMFNRLPDGEFDNPLGVFTGAGVIFGATGGVMEAALRTAVETITGKPVENVTFEAVRGTAGIKKATYQAGDLSVNVAVASGLTNAKEICEAVKNGTCDAQFIEIMCCPGGCVNGGGQPLMDAFVRNNEDYKAKRASALYKQDADAKLRKSHDNPVVKEVYETFLGQPGSKVAHHVLHTSYSSKK